MVHTLSLEQKPYLLNLFKEIKENGMFLLQFTITNKHFTQSKKRYVLTSLWETQTKAPWKTVPIARNKPGHCYEYICRLVRPTGLSGHLRIKDPSIQY